jgi:acylphosphatase
VRNADDGTVEAVLEGDEAAVTRVIDFCRRGPSGASVAHVAVSEEPPEGLAAFEVR